MNLVLSIVFGAIYIALLGVFIAMWARFIFDWIQALNRSWRPQGGVVIAAELSYTITDPPIKAVRRVIPPLRLGAVQLDLAWTIVLIVIYILMTITQSIAFAR
ncbi:YggT family protein [Microcella daejeonensis]|uniref:YggT family protein n=1 Tax=Microcella daejeonensis TaxID=2994971 RepID=A0A9E8MKT4_9MICO|nr:YggT family protein [Microcella daejeonensis]WAB81356.1 YggT family protein [Microcella daejeonensis]WAB83524.1 YggT family protein [Microcella daejeonensis]